ncbi:hypothetical protein CCACVL1_26161 [Corchorus capsularis]|uniref:Uncharacterized protein n=1 Tax=Corchorus capsularis TaxID=210143 RepID=A0A1R3GFS3_COCAP|nr:hypothetical protein CCACVL1_26161 [Corchorus capsularis]
MGRDGVGIASSASFPPTLLSCHTPPR